MDDLLNEFLTETSESLDVVDMELVKFEKDPNNSEILDNIFRLVHTIKGTCGFLGLPRLEALAHAAETLMGKFRDGVPVTQDAVSLILGSLDRVKEILAELEASETEPEGNDEDLISQLDVLSGVGDSIAGAAPEPQDSAEPEDTSGEDSGGLKIVQRELKAGEVSLDDLERAFQEADGPDDMGPPPVPETFKSPETEPAAVENKPKEEPKKSEKSGAEKREVSVQNQSIRVNVDTLETLMTMVSELVLTRNQLLEMVRRHSDSEFHVPLQRLSSVTAELQEGVMKTRMQPIGNAWQKLPRIVRDLANELDKKIELVMKGAETELDRQVLELIKDPLTHMVRNSADHGLETTQERIDAGKPELGIITLEAYHEGGHIIIQISEDGRGLNTERIKKKIIENGLATEAELEVLPEDQIHRFIFRAGFSTAAAVTSVSGRGVGMDVVRTNIELIGGSVDVKSKAGQGSVFSIKIPLTLAIVSALIVESNAQRFAVPQLNVVELVRAQAGSDHRIELINDTPLLRLRSKLLPLVKLAQILDLPEVVEDLPTETGGITLDQEAVVVDEGDGAAGSETETEIEIEVSSHEDEAASQPRQELETGEEGFIIVTKVGEKTFGIVVDSVFDTEEIVVKPMSYRLRENNLFSGNTILGDGSVIMIVDPNGVANKISGESFHQDKSEVTEDTSHITSGSGVVSILLFKAGSEEPKAVPLSLVTRLEEIDVSTIERSNDRDLVQYRGKLMPLVYMDPERKAKENGRQPILVFTDDEHAMGLAVDEIVDIVDERLDVEVESMRPGTVGSAVIRDVATEVIDIGHYLPQAFDNWFHRQEKGIVGTKRKLLLVDDSSFFRNMLTPVLGAQGFEVIAVDSPLEAIKLHDDGEIYDVIVSDIEMPEMNGFEFARYVRANKNWSNTPIIAISSFTSNSAIEQGKDAGFHDYVAKFDREGLIQILRQTCDIIGEAA
jgi:two-component system, chemotaxis family, sensor kinase CheA